MNEFLHTPNTIIIPQLQQQQAQATENTTGGNNTSVVDTKTSDEIAATVVAATEMADASTTTITTDLSNLGSIPLSFGEQQYTLINFGGQTLQLPVMNISNTSISLQVPADAGTITHHHQQQVNDSNNTGNVGPGGVIQLQNHRTGQLTLTNDNTATMSLSPDENTLLLDATNPINQEVEGSIHSHHTLTTNSAGVDTELSMHHHHSDGGNGVDPIPLTLTSARNDTLTLASHTGGPSDDDDDDSLMANLEVLDTGHAVSHPSSSNEANCHGDKRTIKQGRRDDAEAPPRFEISSLENEIDEAVKATY